MCFAITQDTGASTLCQTGHVRVHCMLHSPHRTAPHRAGPHHTTPHHATRTPVAMRSCHSMAAELVAAGNSTVPTGHVTYRCHCKGGEGPARTTPRSCQGRACYLPVMAYDLEAPPRSSTCSADSRSRVGHELVTSRPRVGRSHARREPPRPGQPL
jgi:hypothetical protein